MEQTDPRASLTAVVGVVVLAVLGMVGTFVLLYTGKDPAAVAAFATPAALAIGGVVALATTRGRSPEPAPAPVPPQILADLKTAAEATP